jgi:hypothetical protein
LPVGEAHGAPDGGAAVRLVRIGHDSDATEDVRMPFQCRRGIPYCRPDRARVIR